MRSSGIIITAAAVTLATTTGTVSTAVLAAAPAAAPAKACTSWQLMPAPPMPTGESSGTLQSVSATSPDDISFTGTAYNPDHPSSAFGIQGLVIRWNGHALTDGPQISPGWLPDDDPGALSSFDSASDGWSFAADESGPQLAYTPDAVPDSGASSLTPENAHRWHDGRWTTVPLAPYPVQSPPAAVPPIPVVDQVASLSPSNAWAVGEFGPADTGTLVPLIEHWDGTQWSIVPSPAVAGGKGELFGLDVLAPDNIWAAGDQNDGPLGSPGEPLIEHWDGSTWTIVPAPSAQPTSQLYAVSATGPDDIWAAGDQNNSQTGPQEYHPLVEHWDGSTWTVQKLPSIGVAALTSVYAASPDDVWAVAQVEPPPHPQSTLADHPSVFLHWDGSSWSTVPVPGPQEFNMVMNYSMIGGAGPGDVWAAGTVFDFGNGFIAPLIAHLSCG
jgi:hypothetical protein